VTPLAEKAPLLDEDSKEDRERVYKKDREDTKKYDEITKELIKQMEVLKVFDEAHEKSGKAEMFKNIQYVDREDDPEIKQNYEQNE
jgi:predicted glycoside hydrolase/deacetylase ChbG (UPF0249 family)